MLRQIDEALQAQAHDSASQTGNSSNSASSQVSFSLTPPEWPTLRGISVSERLEFKKAFEKCKKKYDRLLGQGIRVTIPGIKTQIETEVCSDIVDYELKTEYDSVEATPDKEIEDFILNDRIEGAKNFKINATPTIIINKKKFEKSLNYKNLKKTLEKLI